MANTTPDSTGGPTGLRRLANWKVAAAGGALLGVGAASLIGVGNDPTQLQSDPIGAVSLREQNTASPNRSVASLASPRSTTVTVPPTTAAPAPAPAPAPVPAPAPAPAPAPSPASVRSVASPPPAPAPAPAPVQTWSAPSPVSPVSAPSPVSVASVDSP